MNTYFILVNGKYAGETNEEGLMDRVSLYIKNAKENAKGEKIEINVIKGEQVLYYRG